MKINAYVEALDDLTWKDEHWNRFKGNVGETSERRGGAHMGFSERIDIILNWTKWTELSQSFERCITVLTVDSLGPVEENFQPLTF